MNRVLRVAVLLSFVASVLEISRAFAGPGDQVFPTDPALTGVRPIVRTRYGALQGVAIEGLYAFRGIPYAAPPVGELRWRVPQDPERWKGVRDASGFGNVCPQINYGGQLVGNEDCLTLNIYVSQKPVSHRQPVMVFIPGGSNLQGDAQIPPQGMPFTPLHGVVVVTVQYRLGMLGFFANPLLTLEGGGASGHYGLADQVAALQWVHKNIAAFGGDPRHVMLFGQSAGGWDVQMLLAAPSAKGLFSVAADESGSLPAGLVPNLQTLETTDESFVAAAGCSGAGDVLACMRAVPADTIVNLQAGYRFYSAVGSPFLPTDPFLVLQDSGSPVPLLIGSNREEDALFEDPNSGIDNTAYIAAVHQRFDSFGAGVANKVLSLYPSSAYTNPAYALIAVDTDFGFTCDTRNLARAAAGPNREPIWRYLYTHALENNPYWNSLRAFHSQELFFVFDNFSGLGNGYTPTAAEMSLAHSMMSYWTRFAATGDPNGTGTVFWPHYDPSTDSMLQIDDTQTEISGYHNTQCDYLSTLPQI